MTCVRTDVNIICKLNLVNLVWLMGYLIDRHGKIFIVTIFIAQTPIFSPTYSFKIAHFM